MINIPLQVLPNQQFTIQLDQTSYDLSINTCDTGNAQIMAATLLINNVLILSGIRLVTGTPIIPYFYLANGNFVFLTSNDELPDYNQFGITQYLIYASEVELQQIAAGTFAL